MSTSLTIPRHGLVQLLGEPVAELGGGSVGVFLPSEEERDALRRTIQGRPYRAGDAARLDVLLAKLDLLAAYARLGPMERSGPAEGNR